MTKQVIRVETERAQAQCRGIVDELRRQQERAA